MPRIAEENLDTLSVEQRLFLMRHSYAWIGYDHDESWVDNAPGNVLVLEPAREFYENMSDEEFADLKSRCRTYKFDSEAGVVYFKLMTSDVPKPNNIWKPFVIDEEEYEFLQDNLPDFVDRWYPLWLPLHGLDYELQREEYTSYHGDDAAFLHDERVDEQFSALAEESHLYSGLAYYDPNNTYIVFEKAEDRRTAYENLFEYFGEQAQPGADIPDWPVRFDDPAFDNPFGCENYA